MQQYTILHFSQDFARGKTQLGGFRRIFNICSDQHKHIIFTLSARIKKVEEYKIDSIKIIEIPMRKMPLSKRMQFFEFKNIASKINAYLVTQKISPDLMFGHSQLFNFFVLKELRIKFLPRLKICWEANVIWGIHETDNWKGRIVNRLNWVLQRNIFKWSDGIICQTNSSKNFIIKTFGIDANKCSVITNAVFPETIKVQDIKESDQKRILCLGLFDKMNGIPFLVDFIRKMGVLNGFQFHFIGDGLYRPMVEKLDEDGFCKYWGSLSHAEMQEKFSEFDFVIIPRLQSTDADLYIPTKLLESMASGVVPICSNVNGMTDVIINGENGFTFKAGSHADLKKTLFHIKVLGKEEIRIIINNARIAIQENYNWKCMHEKLNNLYEQFIPNH